MKSITKLLILLVSLWSLSVAYADGTTNIRMNFQNAGSQKYYLCLPDAGCFLIQPGKTYPILHRVNTQHIFVMSSQTHLVAPQAPVSSCSTTVKTGHTVTISGRIDNNQRVSGLHCSIN